MTFALTVLLSLVPLLAQASLGSTRLDWGSKAPMPTLRSRLGLAAAPNGKLYAVGGGSATVEEYDPATNTWTTKASLPTPRSRLAVAVATNGKLYAVGGSSGATVEEYDPATNTWTGRAPMPTAREGLGLAAAPNGKLYAVGGSNSAGALGTVEEYDPATNTWATKSSMPTARDSLGLAAAPNGKLYAVGGINGTAFAIVEEYDPAADTWVARAAMPTVRSRLSLVAAANGKLYAVGGIRGAGAPPDCPRICATVEEYDPATNTWAGRAPIPTARYDFGLAAAPNGRLYAVGGADQTPPFFVEVLVTTVEEYDPTGNAWSVPPSLSLSGYPPRLYAASAVVNGRIYVIGGQDGGGAPQDTVFEYTPATNAWRLLNAHMPTPRYAAAATVANGKVYVVGGYNGGGFLPTVEELDPTANGGNGVWRGNADGIRQLPVPRAFAGLATAGNGKIYVAGGGNVTGVLDLVQEYDPPPINAPWLSVQSMPTRRDGVALIPASDGRLYAVGGENFTGPGAALIPLTTVEAFTPPPSGGPQGSWSLGTVPAPLPQARWDAGLVRGPPGKLFAIGGSSTDGAAPTAAADVFEYDVGANVWSGQSGELVRGRMPTARYGHTVSVPGQQIFAIGGQVAGGGINAFEVATFTELPTVSAGGPYSVASGGSIQLSGGGSDPEGSALAFAWDLDGDLLYETNGQNPTFSALGIPAGTVRTVRVRAADTSGAYALASTTVTVNQIGCGPRPNVSLATSRPGPGQLRAILAAQASSNTPTNALSSIRIISIVNAAVTFDGSPVGAGQTVALPGGTQQATLLLDRNAPGQNPGLTSTVAFAVTDICGEWRTFVGGGPSAF